jgi:polyferredoxin
VSYRLPPATYYNYDMNGTGKNIRYLRYGVQAVFFLLTLHIGYTFYRFVLHFEAPGHPFMQKPPSADAFLPIAGMMSFKYFLTTGVIEPVHPSALIMFLAIVSVSLLLKKGFCGWICPIGTLSQWFWMAGGRVFGRNFRIWRYADILLRSVKYILMIFFLFVIWGTMPPAALEAFFLSDYYKIADIKTMKFFTEMSTAAVWFLAGTGVLSLIYKNFWCRYLCPYGALLGLLSRLSPVKINRDERNCSHCHSCTTHCPALIDVEKQGAVRSGECFGCMTCVSVCPARGALAISLMTGRKRKAFSPYLYPAALVLLFSLIIGSGIAAGKWRSGLTYRQYVHLIPETSRLTHP